MSGTINYAVLNSLRITMAEGPNGVLFAGFVKWVVIWYPLVVFVFIMVGLCVKTQYLTLIIVLILRVVRAPRVIKLPCAHVAHSIKKIFFTINRSDSKPAAVMIIALRDTVT